MWKSRNRRPEAPSSPQRRRPLGVERLEDRLAPAAVVGRVFDDSNGNGAADPGEPGQAGVTVQLDVDADGTVDASADTDADGNYAFLGLAAGTYRVTQVVPAGRVQTSADRADLALGQNETAVGVDFGNFTRFAVRGQVFDDLNANGARDGGEPGLAGVTVQLSGAATATAVTDADGNYAFTDLGPGSYRVTPVAPAGRQTTAGPADVAAVSGADVPGVDFGTTALLLSIGDATVTGGTAVFTVTLAAASGQEVTVGFATADGTAAAGSDYEAAGGTLTFQPGETTQQVTVQVLGVPAGAGRTFFVDLSGPAGAVVARGRGTATIAGDDLPPAGSIDLDAASDTGLFDDDDYTGDDTPGFTVLAPAGQTVRVRVNGGAELEAAETGPGVYAVTLPPGLLRVGDNLVTATAGDGQGTGRELTPLKVVYAPSMQANAFVVPGAAGAGQQVTFALTSSETAFSSEVGYFLVDDPAGRVGGLAPGDPGYAQAAVSRGQVLLAPGAAVGAAVTLSLQGGQSVAFYLIQNGTSAEFLAGNPGNVVGGGPVAFFNLAGANPDGVAHAQVVGDPTRGEAVYSWEDLTGGGDSDYNDMVVTVRAGGAAAPPGQVVTVPAGAGRDAALTFELQVAAKSLLNPNPTTSDKSPGEVGYFLVDGPDGRIGGLRPGDAGYAQAALTARRVLFAPGDAAGAQQASTAPGGALLAFYLVVGGSAADVLATNPGNALTGGPVAFFSVAAANPDGGATHFRTFSPEQVTQPEPGDDRTLRIHAMGEPFGGSGEFDDLLFTLTFAAPRTGSALA